MSSKRSTALAAPEQDGLQTVTEPTGLQMQALFERVISSGPGAADALEKLVDLQERVERRAAEKSFFRALAAFQSQMPQIEKSRAVRFQQTSYNYAGFQEIAEAVRQPLMDNGLSYTFDSEDANGMLRCTCTLRHEDGHSIQGSFSCPTESKAGMSGQQKYGAALTFAKRNALVSVLGLTLADPDPEQQRRDKEQAAGVVTPEQAQNLRALAAEVNVSEAKLLGFYKADSIDAFPASKYADAIKTLQARRGGGK